MANYADYVKNDVDAELQEVQANRNIPESVVRRFDGKSIEDVLESYANLEQMSSRQGQELGELRSQVSRLVDLQLQTKASSEAPVTAQPDEPAITVDDLYDNPQAALETVASRVVNKKVDTKVSALEKEIQKLNRDRAIVELTAKHPNWKTEVQSPEFKTWANSSAYRQRLAAQADQFDFVAADDLLEMWKDHTQKSQEANVEALREQQLRDATLESTSPGLVEGMGTAFTRSQIIEQKRAAKMGDRKAEAWLRANAEEIAIAYEEGRII
jgi:hypothetical protein